MLPIGFATSSTNPAPPLSMSYPRGDYEDASDRSLKSRLYKRLSSDRVPAGLTIGPPLLLYLVVLTFPIAWTIAASFHNIDTLNPVWNFAGLSNFVSVITDEFFHYTLYVSFLFAAGSIAIQTTVGVLFALLFNQRFKMEKLASAVFFLPFLVPTAIVGYMLIWMLNGSYGIVNAIFVDLGVISQPISWFGSLETALPSVIVATSWKYIALVTIMTYARLQSIPDQLYEIAEMMGANAWEQFRDITAPNIRGVVLIVTLLNGLWMFFKFDIIWILTQGWPRDATRLSVIYAYQEAFESFNLGRAAAMSVLLFMIVIIGAMLYFRYFQPEEEVRVE